MRDSLKSLMEHCIGLKYSLPNTGSSIPKITVSTLSDKCYQVLTSDGDLSKIIYNGIIEYSFDESSIDLTKLDTLQKRALISRMKFDRAATEEQQLKYGFYGEVLLFLMLQHFYGAETFISRGHFYNPLESSETKGFDTYQMLQKSDGSIELWFGEVKFHKSFRTGVNQILEKINISLSDDYLNKNFIAMEDFETFVNSKVSISPILDAFRNNPTVNLAEVARNNGMSFVYPMLVVFNDEGKSYDEIIKSVVDYTNNRFTQLNINFSLEYSLFFILLPVSVAKDIKDQVRKWILSNQQVI